MFRMEKFKLHENNDEIDDIHKIRTSFLDSNIINMMKNKQTKHNSEFLQSKRLYNDIPLEKLKFMEQTNQNHNLTKEKSNTGVETKQLTLEELEEIISSKILN